MRDSGALAAVESPPARPRPFDLARASTISARTTPEAVVRLITALLVLVLDPLAVLLTLAAARG